MRTRTTVAAAMVLAVGAVLGWLAASGRLSTALAQDKSEPPPTGGTQLPKPDPEFRGKVGETLKDSTPSYPQPLKAPKGAPNVLIVLLDDVGFGHTGTFGGPVPTPTPDRLGKSKGTAKTSSPT